MKCINCKHGNNYIDCKNPKRKAGVKDFNCWTEDLPEDKKQPTDVNETDLINKDEDILLDFGEDKDLKKRYSSLLNSDKTLFYAGYKLAKEQSKAEIEQKNKMFNTQTLRIRERDKRIKELEQQNIDIKDLVERCLHEDPNDEDGAAVTPATVTWTLTDFNGKVINSRKDVSIVTPSTTNSFLLSVADLNPADGLVRIVTCDAVYTSSTSGAGIPLRDQGQFSISAFTEPL